MGHHLSANLEGQAFGALIKTSIKQHDRHFEVMRHHPSANPNGQTFGAFTKTFATTLDRTPIKNVITVRKKGTPKTSAGFSIPSSACKASGGREIRTRGR
jgi:hypothetical protein